MAVARALVVAARAEGARVLEEAEMAAAERAWAEGEMALAAAATAEVEMAVVEMVVEMAVARAEEVMVAGTASDLRRARAAVLVTAPGPILAHLPRCALGTRPLTAGRARSFLPHAAL